ncbi:uncharacterized protein TNCV_3740931 [Trichonephila clavipes]|nr:uncharacterized protein TNCV_3740931 [Trichonephila clavipes]
MSDFTNSEKADILLIYSAANGNGRAALRLYQECFPSRRMPNPKMFHRLHRQLCENGSLIACTDGRSKSRIVKQTLLEKAILDQVDEKSGTSAVTCRLLVRQPTVLRILLLNCWSNRSIILKKRKKEQKNPYTGDIESSESDFEESDTDSDEIDNVIFEDIANENKILTHEELLLIINKDQQPKVMLNSSSRNQATHPMFLPKLSHTSYNKPSY